MWVLTRHVFSPVMEAIQAEVLIADIQRPAISLAVTGAAELTVTFPSDDTYGVEVVTVKERRFDGAKIQRTARAAVIGGLQALEGYVLVTHRGRRIGSVAYVDRRPLAPNARIAWEKNDRDEDLLHQLEEAAVISGQRPSGLAKLLRDHPTGLVRVLVLLRLGANTTDWRGHAATLDSGSFEDHLSWCWPGIHLLKKHLQTVTDWMWAVQHSGTPLADLETREIGLRRTQRASSPGS